MGFIMKQLTTLIVSLILIMCCQTSWSNKRFGESFCQSPDYSCIKIKSGESWESLFENPEARDIVKRINRMNIRLRPGMIIAIPKNLDRLTIYDVSPFPRYIQPTGEKTIYVNQKQLAWGAYDANGELIWWGPLSSGSANCSEALGGCKTPSGSFRVIRKQDIDCISTAFPIRLDGNNGGAIMPFCMHFYRGFALHGSEIIPGFRDSHGCVRMFIEDAQWLNEEFVDVPGEGGVKGTRVIIDGLT